MNQIILREMSKSFGEKNVIKAQNACFSPGQIYGIVGQNGCGKTVLFKCMSGSLKGIPSFCACSTDALVISKVRRKLSTGRLPETRSITSKSDTSFKSSSIRPRNS